MRLNGLRFVVDHQLVNAMKTKILFPVQSLMTLQSAFASSFRLHDIENVCISSNNRRKKLALLTYLYDGPILTFGLVFVCR